MATPDIAPLEICTTSHRDDLYSFMHLVDVLYWFAVVAVLFYADVDLWVWGTSAFIVLPVYVFGLGYLRWRLGVLRSG